jgi:hypothetical protein
MRDLRYGATLSTLHRSPQYEDLRAGVLGFTRFGKTGAENHHHFAGS